MSHPLFTNAGILCYSVCPDTNEIYFLLCRDRCQPDWPRSASRWSEFGGRRQGTEAAEETAAREFIEESMGLVAINPPMPEHTETDHDSVMYINVHEVMQTLEQGLYTFAVHIIDYNSPFTFAHAHAHAHTNTPTKPVHQPSYRVCFVKRIPWQPEVPERFFAIRRDIDEFLDFTSHHPEMPREFTVESYCHLRPAVRSCPCFHIDVHPDTKQIEHVHVNMDYREKQQLKWWHISQLQTIVNEFLNHPERPQCPLRRSFVKTLALVLLQMQRLHEFAVMSLLRSETNGNHSQEEGSESKSESGSESGSGSESDSR